MTQDSRTIIQLFRSNIPDRKPDIESLELGEIATNFFDAKLFLKRQQDDFQEIVEFIGHVPIKNTIHVQKNGRDSNSGESWSQSVLTIEKALELAWERNELTLIDIGPGVYETEGHLDMPDNCVIRTPHRAVFIRPKPGFEERNVFRMGSGCFIEGPIFENWRLDSLENPSEGFAVCFRPGAVITRVPYAHKIAIRTMPLWTGIAPPLDRNNANPLVGRGAGVALADASVLSPYSIFPNIMTWGATPVSHNGIGYCAKNGGLINAVNAVSLWAHKHFLAIDGGQIILSSCSTQFGDFTMVSEGSRNLIRPLNVKDLKTTDYDIQTKIPNSVKIIHDGKQQIISDLWDYLVDNEFVDGWTIQEEQSTKRDADIFLDSLAISLETASDINIRNFSKSFFDSEGVKVYDLSKEQVFIESFNFIGNAVKQIIPLTGVSDIVDRLVSITIRTLLFPEVKRIPVIDRFNTSINLIPQQSAFLLILSQIESIVDSLWGELVSQNYVSSWSGQDETFTKRDAKILIQLLAWSCKYAEDIGIRDFIKSLFDSNTGNTVFSQDKKQAFLFSFEFIKDSINAIGGITPDTQNMITEFTRLITDAIDKGITVITVIPYEYDDLPFENNIKLSRFDGSFEMIQDKKQEIIDDMWDDLVSKGFTVGWTGNIQDNEEFTKRDANIFLDSIAIALESGKETAMIYFARSLISPTGQKVFTEEKLKGFLYAFEYIRKQLIDLLPETAPVITRLVSALSFSLKNSDIRTILSSKKLDSAIDLQPQENAFILIQNETETIVEELWNQLVSQELVTEAWGQPDEDFTRRDAKILIQSLAWSLKYANEDMIQQFSKSLFDKQGISVFSTDKLSAFIYAFGFIKDYINDIIGINANSQAIVDGLVNSIIESVNLPEFSIQLIPTKFDELSKYKEEILIPQAGMFNLIQSQSDQIVENLWDYLQEIGFTGNWTNIDEELTRKDAKLFLQAVGWVLETANEKPTQDFARSLFDVKGIPVFSDDKLAAFIQSFIFLRDQIKEIDGLTDISKIMTDLLVTALIATLKTPTKIVEPSLITAIGHTWTGVMAGVALTRIPPARNQSTIQESILELNQGVVIASGQDDQGSAIFVGGMEINADTGELSGPPFISAVNRIANKAVIARSF